MIDRVLFASRPDTVRADTRNRSGARAYALGAAERLAQLAVSGSLGDAFYTDAPAQLDELLEAASAVSVETLARTAVYARERAHRKDVPAVLLAVLSVRDTQVFELVFDRVVDNGVMVRTFVQVMRSGVVGRRSLGTTAKRCVARWLNTAPDGRLIGSLVGQAPSLADLVKMVHPRPATPARANLYAWILGRRCDESTLPQGLRELLAFRRGESASVPAVPHRLLTDRPLDVDTWCAIARAAGWQTLRMNLASLARHGVFEREGMAALVAARMTDREAIARSRVLPYQLLVAARSVGGAVPTIVREALDVALETSVANVPRIDGRVVLCPDVSGSMSWPVTGWRGSATTAVRCIDVAALFAAAIVRGNPTATVLPFDHCVHAHVTSAEESLASSARRLAGHGGGGTDCAAPLRRVLEGGEAVDLVVLISDNESWIGRGSGRQTAAMTVWERIRRRWPNARLACIDVQPYATTQVASREDVLNVGGFSDAVFGTVARFANGAWGTACWREEIEGVEL